MTAPALPAWIRSRRYLAVFTVSQESCREPPLTSLTTLNKPSLLYHVAHVSLYFNPVTLSSYLYPTGCLCFFYAYTIWTTRAPSRKANTRSSRRKNQARPRHVRASSLYQKQGINMPWAGSLSVTFLGPRYSSNRVLRTCSRALLRTRTPKANPFRWWLHYRACPFVLAFPASGMHVVRQPCQSTDTTQTRVTGYDPCSESHERSDEVRSIGLYKALVPFPRTRCCRLNRGI
jgi:hypothetical protein